ncbi:PIN domain-containing protein [candidate division KSB1 bacterium]|nr:PIN domain-containing protein [candidate division KSB1 bacterium]
MGIEQVLNLHTHWVIDTAPIIYYIEEHPKYLPLADRVFPRLSSASNSIYAFSSILTLTEVLPHPLRQNNHDLAKRYRDFLLHSRNFVLFPVDEIIAERPAEIRAQYQYRTPDAIQLATGMEHNATLFITNDKRLKNFPDLTILVLDDFLGQTPTP